MVNRSKRVVILADTKTHMMPALAREMARRDHDLVLCDAMDGLADELAALGAKVEVVADTADQTKEDTIQKLVDRAQQVFGGFDAACIRTGVHGTGSILEATAIWKDQRIVTVDRLGDDFLESVQTGDPITVHADGPVEVG
jgi:NAD(P)-dependent dehydrogenase (short-subunit alcohol dehydrogenase family)